MKRLATALFLAHVGPQQQQCLVLVMGWSVATLPTGTLKARAQHELPRYSSLEGPLACCWHGWPSLFVLCSTILEHCSRRT